MGKRDLVFLCVVAVGTFCIVRYLSVPELSAAKNRPSLSESAFIAPTSALAVDSLFAKTWSEREITPAPLADPLLVARRISLALTGTIPSLEEIRGFEDEVRVLSRAEAIYRWTDRLLHDRRSADYLAERMARVFVGIEQEPFLLYRRNRFVSWLSDQFYKNTPYDSFAHSLLTAKGLWTDSPAVNFLTVTVGGAAGDRPDEIRLASRVSRAFLGVRLDCVQCHDDNLGGDWLQSNFHELAAFFSEASPSFVGIIDRERVYNYEYLNATQEVIVEPSVPFDTDLYQASGNRREDLASWVTHRENRAFSRAIVNRVWALAFGKPLVEPIDSIPLEGPYPTGMELLVDEFVESDFDLHRLWHSIFSSEVFQRDSRSPGGVTTKHERFFAAFPLTRLRPEQVAGSLLQSARLTTVDAQSHVVIRLAQMLQTGDFVDHYGDTGEDEFEPGGGTIPQRLVMLNGNLVHDRTGDDAVANAAPRIVGLSATTEDALESYYLTILSRRPSKTELTHFLELRNTQYKDRRMKWGEHVAWTLINSTEFSWNH